MTGLDFGVGRMPWAWFAVAALILLLLPLVTSTGTPTLLAIWCLFALSLGLMWGYAGILSFGHAAYYGLGAYTFAVASFNMNDTTVPLLLAMIVPALVAAVIGAMMFYGRISDVYLGVITLVVTLILNRFMGATAGDEARRLQRHARFPDAQRPRQSLGGDLWRRSLLRHRRQPVAGLSAGALDPRQRLRADARRHPRERAAHGALGL
jgi:hypothetical protein